MIHRCSPISSSSSRTDEEVHCFLVCVLPWCSFAALHHVRSITTESRQVLDLVLLLILPHRLYNRVLLVLNLISLSRCYSRHQGQWQQKERRWWSDVQGIIFLLVLRPIDHPCNHFDVVLDCDAGKYWRFEFAWLLARLRAMLSLQEGDGELQVHSRRVLPHRLQMHVQGEILSCSFQLRQHPLRGNAKKIYVV